MEVTHSGLDGWRVEWLAVIFDNGHYNYCDNVGNVMIDRDESITPKCGQSVNITVENIIMRSKP